MSGSGRPLQNQKSIMACAIIVLSLSVFLVYWPVQHFEFISYDDNVYVTTNRHVQSGLTWTNIIWAFTTTETANWHPLTWLSLLVDHELYAMNAGGYHWTNLLFHLANTLLLLILLSRITGSFWKSTFVAALFGLHPLHIESVAWVSERKDVLSSFFGLLTLLVYSGYARQQTRKRYYLTLFLFSLSLMSKPMMVTLPFVMLLMDYWPLNRFNSNPIESAIAPNQFSAGHLKKMWPSVFEKIPFFIFSLISGIITIVAQHQGGATSSLTVLPFELRLINAVVSYALYLKKMFWPLDLALLYPHPLSWPLWQICLSFAVLFSISVLVFAFRRNRPYLAMGWLWYLGMLIPVIGIIQVGNQALADRYTYLPLIGVFIMITWGMFDMLKKLKYHRMIFCFLTLGSLIFFIIVSVHQLKFWQDSISVFSRSVAVSKKNNQMHYNLGIAYKDKRLYDKAIDNFNKAIEICPGDPTIHNNLGIALVLKGRSKEAVVEFKRTLQLQPNHAGAHNNLGVVLYRAGETEDAIQHLKKAIILVPDYANAHYYLALSLQRKGSLKEAEVHFRKAVAINKQYQKVELEGSWDVPEINHIAPLAPL